MDNKKKMLIGKELGENGEVGNREERDYRHPRDRR